ncbi:MAG: hypothetical protein ACK526_00410 [Planctomyces sp.]
MAEFLQTVRNIATEHGIKILTAAAFTLAGWLIGRWRAARSWRKREFYNRLNISLNSFVDGKLLIRTILEKTCEEVFLNSHAVERLLQAAQKTTKENPFIPLESEDRWFYLNAVLNELSETFATGLFRREAGQPFQAVRYLICLTNECDGDVRTRKVRAMVIRKDMLLNLPEVQPALESPSHQIRWKTLQQMQKAWTTDPSGFIEAEIVV